MSPRGAICSHFRGSSPDCHEFPFLRDVSSYIGGFRCKFWGAFEEQIHRNWWHHHFMCTQIMMTSSLCGVHVKWWCHSVKERYVSWSLTLRWQHSNVTVWHVVMVLGMTGIYFALLSRWSRVLEFLLRHWRKIFLLLSFCLHRHLS